MSWGRALVLVAAVGLLLGTGTLGCAKPPRGSVLHKVRPGETVWRIARNYGSTVDEIVRANGIKDVRFVKAGSRLLVPRPGGARAIGGGTPGAIRPAWRDAPKARVQRSDGAPNLDWPLRGRLSSRYGRRWGRSHEGIDIAAPTGTPVHAAEAGRVIYSGSGLGAYGNVVIIKHAGRYSTVYAHNRRNRVKKGQFVEKGDRIADVGSTGRATGPHLHFEVRRSRKPLDPLSFLP